MDASTNDILKIIDISGDEPWRFLLDRIDEISTNTGEKHSFQIDNINIQDVPLHKHIIENINTENEKSQIFTLTDNPKQYRHFNQNVVENKDKSDEYWVKRKWEYYIPNDIIFQISFNSDVASVSKTAVIDELLNDISRTTLSDKIPPWAFISERLTDISYNSPSTPSYNFENKQLFDISSIPFFDEYLFNYIDNQYKNGFNYDTNEKELNNDYSNNSIQLNNYYKVLGLDNSNNTFKQIS